MVCLHALENIFGCDCETSGDAAIQVHVHITGKPIRWLGKLGGGRRRKRQRRRCRPNCELNQRNALHLRPRPVYTGTADAAMTRIKTPREVRIEWCGPPRLQDSERSK